MQRRDVLMGLAGGTALLAGCKPGEVAQTAGGAAQERVEWRMYTTWPKNFPGLGTGAARLAERITQMSGGRLTVSVYGAGERVPALEVFDAVSRGSAQMGHGAAYYWKGKAASAPLFCTVPFGFTAQEQNAWLYYGGGMELWREVYEKFNLMPFDAGNTGTQMAGWFNKPIDTLADLRGLKMRVPGLGGEILSKLGVVPVNIPGASCSPRCLPARLMPPNLSALTTIWPSACTAPPAITTIPAGMSRARRLKPSSTWTRGRRCRKTCRPLSRPLARRPRTPCWPR